MDDYKEAREIAELRQFNRLSPAHAADRNLAKIFSMLTLLIGYIYSFFNKPQQVCMI